MDIFSNTSETIGNKMNFILLGDTNVGKTTLFSNYTNLKIGTDSLGNPPKTIGLTVHVKKILYEQNLIIAKFFDFSGDPEYKDDLDVFLKLILASEEANLGEMPLHGVFLVFDVNLKRTLESLKSWLIWLQKNLVLIGESQGKSSKEICEGIREKIKNIPVFIIGNKIDKLTKKSGLKMNELNQRNQVSGNFNKIIQRVTDFLRKKFTLIDFDNVLFLSKDLDSEGIEAINELVVASFAFFCPEIGINSKIEVEAFTLDRCIGWDYGRNQGNLKNGFFSFVKKFFNKEEEGETLSLYPVSS